MFAIITLYVFNRPQGPFRPCSSSSAPSAGFASSFASAIQLGYLAANKGYQSIHTTSPAFTSVMSDDKGTCAVPKEQLRITDRVSIMIHVFGVVFRVSIQGYGYG